jgi:hypothetical protein
MPISPPSAEPLVFDWDAPRGRDLAIAGFLVLSFITHAFCFYVFQIVYPPAVSLLPPPARLSLITPASEEGRTLLQWVEAEDPALASRTLRPPEAKAYLLPRLEHVPSYFASEPVLKQPPPLVVDLRVPSSQPPGPVPLTYPRPARTSAVVPTTVTFSKEIDDLGEPVFPQPKFSSSIREEPEAVRFRIAVNRSGEIRYCFPINFSGDTQLDEQARSYLALCRFRGRSTSAEREQLLVWGTASVQWGNDVARPQATPTNTPAP